MVRNRILGKGLAFAAALVPALAGAQDALTIGLPELLEQIATLPGYSGEAVVSFETPGSVQIYAEQAQSGRYLSVFDGAIANVDPTVPVVGMPSFAAGIFQPEDFVVTYDPGYLQAGTILRTRALIDSDESFLGTSSIDLELPVGTQTVSIPAANGMSDMPMEAVTVLTAAPGYDQRGTYRDLLVCAVGAMIKDKGFGLQMYAVGQERDRTSGYAYAVIVPSEVYHMSGNQWHLLVVTFRKSLTASGTNAAGTVFIAQVSLIVEGPSPRNRGLLSLGSAPDIGQFSEPNLSDGSNQDFANRLETYYKAACLDPAPS